MCSYLAKCEGQALLKGGRGLPQYEGDKAAYASTIPFIGFISQKYSTNTRESDVAMLHGELDSVSRLRLGAGPPNCSHDPTRPAFAFLG